MDSDVLETDEFYKLVVRNNDKTIILDLPNKWVRIRVTAQNYIDPQVAPTFQDLDIPQKAFDEAKKSDNLKSAVGQVFGNYQIKRAYVVENETIERKRQTESERVT